MSQLFSVLGVLLGVYGACLLLCVAILGVGLVVAGKSLGARAGYTMMVVVAACGLLLLTSVGVVYWALSPIGLSPTLRTGITVLYGVLAVLSGLGVGMLSAVAFNR